MNPAEQQVDPEYEALKNSKFKQQKLPAWRPVPTIFSTTLTFFFFGVAFIVIGAVVLVYSNDIQEISIPYPAGCTKDVNNTCIITFPSTSPNMTTPIMVYYQLNNFYQNHRRYVKSKSNAQLGGEIITAAALNSSKECDPVYYMSQLDTLYSINGTKLDPAAPANPCGLIAKSMFNDTFQLLDPKGNNVTINDKNIAWQADKDLKYKYPEDPDQNRKDPNFWKTIQWRDVMDEHFMVWMRPAGLPNFRKLWGRIDANVTGSLDLSTGYQLKVVDNYDVTKFSGEKFFVLSTVNAFGGKNSFLGISYIVVGSICIVMAIAFVIGYKMHNQRQDV